jgi:hypothetical protein
LKASSNNYRQPLLWLLVMAFSIFAAGCSDDESTSGVVVEDLSIMTIILSPKSAEPGDTVQATVILEGTTQTYPSVSWQATGGTFIETNKTTVGWVAPTTTGVFRLGCTATSASASVSEAADVFVGRTTTAVGGAGGEIHLLGTGRDFYYLWSPKGADSDWDSSDVWIYTGGRTPAAAPDTRGTQYVFNSDLTKAAQVTFGATNPLNTEDPIDVWLVDLTAGTRAPITSDGSLVGGSRHQQYQYPAFSPNDNMLAYQAFLPNPELGEADSLDVYVRYLLSDEVVNVTRSDTASAQRNNLFPTFSSNNNWLVVVSDRNASNVWEFYGLPISGGEVDTLWSSVVQLTNNGGMAGVGAVGSVDKPMMTWNPATSTSMLAVVGEDDLLHLVVMNPTGANTNTVTDFRGLFNQIIWSEDGTQLAVSVVGRVVAGGPTVNAIYTVNTAGDATLRHAAIPGDRIYDMAWSPDNQILVYRIVRSGQAWFEILDIGGATDFLGPVVITPSAGDGSRAEYAAEMDTGVRFDANGFVYMLNFDKATPTITFMDISGTLP